MKNFDQIIWQEKLTFVDFYATWCAPCRQMHPIVDQFEDRMSERAEVCRIDIEDPDMQEIVRRYSTSPRRKNMSVGARCCGARAAA